MKALANFLIAASALCALPNRAVAQSAAPAEGFNAFRMIRNRAIFDPERHSTRSEAPPTAMQAPRTNFIALTGTMVADGKKLAFFSGSRSDYSKVIPEGESIADFKLVNITPAQVELSLAGKALTVAVGQHVPLEGSSVPATSDVPVTTPPAGEAAPSAAAPAASYSGGRERQRGSDRLSRSGSTSATTPAPQASVPGQAPAPAGDKAEILRRMMERRQQEMSK